MTHLFISKDKRFIVVWVCDFEQVYVVFYKERFFATMNKFSECLNYLGKDYKTIKIDKKYEVA